MCGRYAAAKDPAALAVEFEATVDAAPEPDYNVAPTKAGLIVVDRSRGDSRERSLEVARWGLVPSWSKDPSVGARMINARSETIQDKPSYRRSFARRRCLVPADGYYEWYLPSGSKAKQPFYVTDDRGSSLAMAGVYEWWRDLASPKEPPEDSSSGWLLTFSVLTVPSQGGIEFIHDRMPALIAREDWPEWLDPEVDADSASGIVARTSADHLMATPVSTLVNNVRNNGPELIAPLPLGS